MRQFCLLVPAQSVTQEVRTTLKLSNPKNVKSSVYFLSDTFCLLVAARCVMVVEAVHKKVNTILSPPCQSDTGNYIIVL